MLIKILGLGAFALVAEGAILSYYSDTNCQNELGSINIWDNTCHPGVGPTFNSMKITTGSWDNTQCVQAYVDGDACSGDTVGVHGYSVGDCINTNILTGEGYAGSNSMGSWSNAVCRV